MTHFAQRFSTPIGECSLAVNDEGALVRIAFPKAALSKRDDDIVWDESPCRTAIEQLRAYFSGERQAFDIDVAPAGTPFQHRVWKALREIPYGSTISYGQVAARIGQTRASQAVGHANGANPIPIVIPCHRVIGADGSLTGYGGGLETKKKLLQLEGALLA